MLHIQIGTLVLYKKVLADKDNNTTSLSNQYTFILCFVHNLKFIVVWFIIKAQIYDITYNFLNTSTVIKKYLPKNMKECDGVKI